jgi:formylglycine-generating enzyme required for sulfatase activity
VPLTAKGLCDGAPPLVLGKELTLRSGPIIVDSLKPQSDCGPKGVATGAVAASLTIDQPGMYHVEVLHVTPDSADPALLVRKTCSDPSTQVACNDDIRAGDTLSALDVQLDAGTYSVHVLGVSDGSGGTAVGPTDITLKADLSSHWSMAAAGSASAQPHDPRLLIHGVDATPPTEPQPGVTIDRLALLHVRPGIQSTAYVVLRGNCSGAMAQLSATAPYQRVVASEASTCIDTENVREALKDEPTIAGVAAIGSLPDHRMEFVDGLGCPDASKAPQPQTLCVPGGAMVLGEADLSGEGIQDSVPQRVVKLTPFWMDVNEVTVAEWRSAIAAGLMPPSTPQVNDAPLAAANNVPGTCSYSTKPMGREDYAVTCLVREAARAYCQFFRGDLPTEAQWEYAASDANFWDGYKETYPWQNTPKRPDYCDGAVFGRDLTGGSPEGCYGRGGSDPTIIGYGPLPVTARATMDGDMTHLGLVGLTGGVSEMVRDAFEPYSSDCWLSAPLVNPQCAEQFAPQIGTRGGAWDTEGYSLYAETRQSLPSNFYSTDVGFRCVYEIR